MKAVVAYHRDELAANNWDTLITKPYKTYGPYKSSSTAWAVASRLRNRFRQLVIFAYTVPKS